MKLSSLILIQHIQFDLQESSHVCCCFYYTVEAYVEPSQATKMELSAVNVFFAKSSILDVGLASKYTSGLAMKFVQGIFKNLEK